MAISTHEIREEIKQAAKVLRAQRKDASQRRVDYLPPIQNYAPLSRWALQNNENTFFSTSEEHLEENEIIEKCCALLRQNQYPNEAAFVKHFFVQNKSFIETFIRLNKEYDALILETKEKDPISQADLNALESKRLELLSHQNRLRDTALKIFNDANQTSEHADNLETAFIALLITAGVLGGLGLLGALAPAVAAGLFATAIDAIPAVVGVLLTSLLFIPILFSGAPRDPITEQNDVAALGACLVLTAMLSYELWNIMFPAILTAVPALSVGMSLIAVGSLIASVTCNYFGSQFEAESDRKFEEHLDKDLKRQFPDNDEDDQVFGEERDPSQVPSFS